MSKTNATPPTTTWPIDSRSFSPGLAAKIGLNEAIVLSTVHDLLRKSKNKRDEHRWVFNTLPDWHKHFFPWWSLITVERAFKSLRELGLLLATSEYNKRKGDRTLWYRIDYGKLDAFTKDITPPRLPRKAPKVRVNDAGTGLIVNFSPRSAPASSKVPDVDVQHDHATGDKQPAPSPTTTPKPKAASAPVPQPKCHKPKASLDEKLKASGLNRKRVISAMSDALKAKEQGRVAVFRHMRANGVIVPFELQESVIEAYNAHVG
jgi:hypothetical protein